MSFTKVAAPPPAPAAVDPGQASLSFIQAMASPELQGQLFNAEATYRPQYTALSQRDLQNTLLGVAPGTAEGFYGTLDLADMAARRQAALQQSLQTQATEFGLAQLGAYAPQAREAYLAANPQMAAALAQAESFGGRQASGYLNEMGRLAMQPAMQAQVTPMAGTGYTPVSAQQLAAAGTMSPERVAAERIAAERIAAGQVQAGEVGAGALGQSLYQQALRNQQLSPLSQALQAQGLGMATAPGQITPEEARAATQGARERFASTGRLEDISAITGEALARAGASREARMQDLAASQAINAQLLGAQQAGQGLATDVLRADIARQQANVATGLQAGTFNVEAALRAAQANQQTGLQASQANQDAFLRAALANQQTGLQAALANQQAGMQADQFNISNLQDVNRFNIQTGLDTSRFNADAANRFAEANRGFNYTAQQDYLRNLGLLGQATQGLRDADRAYNLNQVNTYGGVSNAGLNAAGYNQPPPGVAGATNYFTLGSTVTPSQKFDPNAGVNLAATTAANLSNYGANIYSADQARKAAEAQAAATRSAGKSSFFGNILGGALGGLVGGLFGGDKKK